MAFSKEILEKNGVELGFAVTSIEGLKVGADYIFADTGMGNWIPGYRYRGLDVTGKYFLFVDMLEPAEWSKKDIMAFSREDLLDIINHSQLATEA